ncbi:MAG TPA: hypothetical protein VFG89_10290 [Coriobacteriia bacterium]|nr:hypothetical protein [Coriobacteriia bacterium]
MTIGRMMLLELRRMAVSPRWGIVGAVCLIAAWLAESSVRVAAINSHVPAGAEDVYLATANNLMLVGCLALPAFALVATGSLAADRSSGFVTLTLCRVGRRSCVWIAKVVALIGGAFITQLVLAATSYMVAIYAGYTPSYSPSALALVPISETSMSLFAPALPGDDQTLRVLAAMGFLTLAFSAVGTLALAVSVRWPNEFLPPALLLGVVVFDWLIVRFSHLGVFDRISLSAHLLESTHISTLPDSMSWASSVAYFAVVMILGAVGGWWLLERYDV